jgi:hypothetical protein
MGNITQGNYTESFARPLRRRFLSTARPPGVALRTKKPWVVLRFLLLGLYVFDIVELLYTICIKKQEYSEYIQNYK